MVKLFDCDGLRSALCAKFRSVSAVEFELSLAHRETDLPSVVADAVDALRASLDENPWHATLTFAVPEFVRGKILAPVTKESILYAVESVSEGTENDAVSLQAIDALCPGLRTHPDGEKYLKQVILPFRSFALCHIVAMIVENMTTNTKPNKGRVWAVLGPFSDSPRDAATALRMVANADLLGIQKLKATAKRATLLVFCEAYLRKDSVMVAACAEKGLTFAMCAVGTVTLLKRAAAIGDPVAQSSLGKLLEGTDDIHAIGWYEECLDGVDEWGSLAIDGIPWGTPQRARKDATEGQQRLEAKRRRSSEEQSKKLKYWKKGWWGRVVVGLGIVVGVVAFSFS